MLIKPSKKNLKNFLCKVREIIKRNPTLPAWKLIGQLNPVIRGWATYHRHVVAKETFNYVDTQIWRAIWRWCVRRHPEKDCGGSPDDTSPLKAGAGSLKP
ncbi:hypothetical protein MWK74_26395 [Escherichia coli]|nr:hypothetical protein [Escherichia coli]MCS2122843.1 hypothetical protein [Escherichia coli]